MKRQRGFTLLEVMIAIGIFALLGIATYQMLDSVLKADEVTRQHEKTLRELTRAFASFDRDLAQTVARTVRDPYGDERAGLLGEQGAADGSSALEFTRAGWRNPLGQPRAQLQRVRWRLVGEQLERVYWSVLDQAVDSPARVQKVLDGVKAIELRYMDERGQWQQQWPPAQSQLTPEQRRRLMPLAVELKIEHRHYGDLTRLYRLPEPSLDATVEEQAPPPAGDSDTEQSPPGEAKVTT
jgi:general secretion pathway protein J